MNRRDALTDDVQRTIATLPNHGRLLMIRYGPAPRPRPSPPARSRP